MGITKAARLDMLDSLRNSLGTCVASCYELKVEVVCLYLFHRLSKLLPKLWMKSTGRYRFDLIDRPDVIPNSSFQNLLRNILRIVGSMWGCSYADVSKKFTPRH